MPRRNITILLAALVVAWLCAVRNESNPYARYASEAYRLIDRHALDRPDNEELFAGAMRGMVDTLRRQGDEHSAYVEPRRAEPLRAEMRQEFGGIGVKIKLEGEPAQLMIAEPPYPGTPAGRSEIRKGDQITAIDGDPVAGIPLEEILGRMRGKPGAPLLLAILHAGASESVDVRLIREVIRLPSLFGDRRRPDGSWEFRLLSNDQIAHLRIVSFGNRTIEEVDTTCRRLLDQGVRAVVLDVRNNSGGALDAAVGVSDLFLEAGLPIVSTRGRRGDVVESFEAVTGTRYDALPIVVLIDRNSASASEILAAALQDNDRAKVVGERSFGKGTVQQLLPIESGRSLLKLTSASYWRPSGENIHRGPGEPESATWGVSPDVGYEILSTEDELRAWYDWRIERDLIADPNEAPPDKASPSIVHDRALAQAVELLRGESTGRAL